LELVAVDLVLEYTVVVSVVGLVVHHHQTLGGAVEQIDIALHHCSRQWRGDEELLPVF